MISSFQPIRAADTHPVPEEHVISGHLAMSNLDTVIKDLVIANRILAREDVVDAYGHVSIRHPDNPKHFFLARSLAPELVEPPDIVELGLDGQPVRDEKRWLYLERFIHAAIYEARPDIHAVVHAHAEDILPFGIAQATPLRPVIHSGSFIGANVPVWDIADKFGDTNLLVTNMEQGRDLAKCLADNNVALMRGHGFASAARSCTPSNWAAKSNIFAKARSMRATAVTAPIRRKPGGPGNTGRTRPAAVTCSASPSTRTPTRNRERSRHAGRRRISPPSHPRYAAATEAL